MVKTFNTKNTISFTFLYLIIGILLVFVIFLLCKQEKNFISTSSLSSSMQYTDNIPQRNNTSLNNILIYEDPLKPPLKDMTSGRLRNIEYSQMGILTREESDKHPIILPLMGRLLYRGDKVQYYTISNSGSNNTKLPIKKNGKYCTNERGCDELYTGDEVYVEGYQNSFKVTVYENKTFEYIL